MKQMDKRLSAILGFVPDCRVAADIGTDHGLLGCALLEENRCENVWFTDISEKSLEKAKRLVEKKNLAHRAAFFVGDGAQALPSKPDAAIIAGMGGKTICGILERGLCKLGESALVLGANTELGELRNVLCNNGFAITDEKAVREGRRFYVVVAAAPGNMKLKDDELLTGPILSKKTDEETKDYFIYRRRGVLIALEKAGASPNADTEALRKELELWEKLI